MLKLSSGRTLYYGKGDVLVYRTHAKPLETLPIPESPFAGNKNVIFAHNVKFAVSGESLLASFTEGENGKVVATDSMKNFLLRQAGSFEGSATEELLAFLSGRFLERYSHIDAIEISADRIPFQSALVPGPGGFYDSSLVFRRSHNECASAGLEISRGESGPQIVSHWCGLSDLQLIKVSGSSFYGFIRDEYTTLPETRDRPLFIFLDILWKYEDVGDALKPEAGRYVAAEQIRDIAHNVFYEFATPSIQYLIWLIGQRILTRFPQLAEVRFESNNRTWETVVEPLDGQSSGVFTEPRPPYGFQGFSMTRGDLMGAPENLS
ncbi:factor-independent urate hydroxylase [Cohnella sp. REN36]|uniref:factor-independent urate hydroxylase n=1 Tax=Cohnella sp. REN36 TaxID=2887347 RepID=UPI001D15984D|nr:urate oxidase [Cohnella sp. REN36]MCC3372683.1 urate oxidase [Cohnella sp. REN36]